MPTIQDQKLNELSKREIFALVILNGFLSGLGPGEREQLIKLGPDKLCNNSIIVADVLLAQLHQTQK